MLKATSINTLADVDAGAWDALAGDDDPFAEHAFLHTLESSGAVGGDSGWNPRHILVHDGGDLVGALPLYEKEHSYGEYIFDWAWADASMRMGLRYYPKLVSMAPVTPATGQRLLIPNDADETRRRAIVSKLLDGALAVRDELGASSIHLLFLNEAELLDVRADGRFMPRLSHQFHWHNRGYETFDDFLAEFRSSNRKKLRKERRIAQESGLEIRVLTGDELTPAHWARLREFYRNTCARKGSFPYLPYHFFEHAREHLADRAVVAAAFDGEQMMAASLNFEKGAHLYGRYWGADQRFEMMHFELCYYQLIERAIAKGMRRFEAGAQGHHKLKRGLMPSSVHSAHYIEHPHLHQAIGDFLPREAMAAKRQMNELASHGPFKRGE